jgi:hypothetical protein
MYRFDRVREGYLWLFVFAAAFAVGYSLIRIETIEKGNVANALAAGEVTPAIFDSTDDYVMNSLTVNTLTLDDDIELSETSSRIFERQGLGKIVNRPVPITLGSGVNPTAAQMLNGVFLANMTANITLPSTTDTFAQIPNVQAGDSIEFVIIRTDGTGTPRNISTDVDTQSLGTTQIEDQGVAGELNPGSAYWVWRYNGADVTPIANLYRFS